jgi:AAA ATPase domain
MDPIRNPYAPGAGRVPAALAGREEELDAWRVALARVEAGRDAQSLVVHGLRGVGKTVLLARFAREARARGWLVAEVEARSGRALAALVAEGFHDPLAELARPGVGARVRRALKTALSFRATYDATGTWSFGLELDDDPGGDANTGVFERDLGRFLRDLAGAAVEREVGVAVLVDEAQDLSADELVALCSVIHQANQGGERLVTALAGLPSLPRRLAEAKSYSERLFDYREVGPLRPGAAAAALSEPAWAERVDWDAAALDHVLGAAQGYAYFLQQYGQETWNVAAGPRITLSDARRGVAAGQATLDGGFYRVRWERATPTEKEFMRAMSVDAAGSLMAEVAQRLERPVRSLSASRATLLGKGLIQSPEYGVVAFPVPGMAEFIRRQPKEG